MDGWKTFAFRGKLAVKLRGGYLTYPGKEQENHRLKKP